MEKLIYFWTGLLTGYLVFNFIDVICARFKNNKSASKKKVLSCSHCPEMMLYNENGVMVCSLTRKEIKYSGEILPVCPLQDIGE